MRWRRRALLPPAHLRIYYHRTRNPDAFTRAYDGARDELISRGLRPEHRVLDIGCGIGNLPLGLAGYLTDSYDGMDVHAEAVAWCQRAITARHPTFRFHRADLASRRTTRRVGSRRQPTGFRSGPFLRRDLCGIGLHTHAAR